MIDSTAESPARDSAALREEIQDLKRYLDGLPPDWRAGGSFLAYEERLRELDGELAISQLTALTETKEVVVHAHPMRKPGEYADARAEIVAFLLEMEHHHAEAAARKTAYSRLLTYASLLASSTAMVGLFVPLLSIIGPAVMTAAGAAGMMSLLRLGEKSLTDSRLADYYMALRNEVTHLRVNSAEKRAWEHGDMASARVAALISEMQQAQR